MAREGFFKVAAIIVAATVGDGVFALPYVFQQSGWLLGLFYLAALAGIVSVAHIVYLQTLEKVGEKERLLGLVKIYFGRAGFWIGFVAIVVGLILVLVAYLILGSRFIALSSPLIQPSWAFALFWIAVSLPIVLSDRHAVDLELLGVFATSLIIIFIFGAALPRVGFGGTPAINGKNILLPFGIILLALAGWTGVEPAYESRRRSRQTRTGGAGALAVGTFFAAALYVLFVTGVFGSGAAITSDTVSGLVGWPAWERLLISALGFAAIWTAYMPISREIKNALQKDLGWSETSTRLLLVAVPPLFVLAGVNNFFLIVSFVGGVFLTLQYMLIVAVGRRALALPPLKKILLDTVALVFLLAAVYSVYAFVVH